MRTPRWIQFLSAFLFVFSAAAQVGVYHEAACPSVDPTHMTKMTRAAATASGYVPAPDCHPTRRGIYLGTISPGYPRFTPPQSEDAAPKTERVSSYTRKDGTHVDSYMRSKPTRD